MSDSVSKIVVQAALWLLFLGSVLTWALVLFKARQRWVSGAQDRRFLREVGTPIRLGAVQAATKDAIGPAARLFQAALGALAAIEAHPEPGETPRDAVERALALQLARERRSSEAGLAVLASIGSTAPFVGLFGTVFGIINALRAIGTSGSARLEVVAGPIGEALVATGIGIAVAVPAVLAYNFFVRRLKIHVSDLEQLGLGVLSAVTHGDRQADVRVYRPAPAASAKLEPRREASV